MRKYLITFVMLVVSFLGCQSTQNTETPAKVQVSNDNAETMPTEAPPEVLVSNENTDTVPVDFSQLPDTVESVLKQLGIALEYKLEKTGRCIYVGRYLSDHTVRVETAALVKGESVVLVIVQGEGEIRHVLLNKVNFELRKALSNPRRWSHRRYDNE